MTLGLIINEEHLYKSYINKFNEKFGSLAQMLGRCRENNFNLVFLSLKRMITNEVLSTELEAMILPIEWLQTTSGRLC